MAAVPETPVPDDEVPPPPPGPPTCNFADAGLGCTRDPDHDGQHLMGRIIGGRP